MNFNVVLPVYNGGAKIERTLSSILLQNSVLAGKDTVQCIVVDGASIDDTVQRARSFNDPRIKIISEADEGMYEALAKGLDGTMQDVTCYLSAGELFDPSAFEIVSHVLQSHSEVSWLTGRAITRNADLHIITSELPRPFLRNLIDCGMYGTRLTVIQQESTFWRSDLTQHFDLEKLKTLKLAGDYYLWRCLAQHYELYVVNAHLGSFTNEPGQLSQTVPGAYRRELRSIRRRPKLTERFSALIMRQWAKRVCPSETSIRTINFDHQKRSWELSR
ncbi:glycosyltransferase [Parasedimentitalea psychrophila]|uniref:Glycosyltransferase n=1 Tax=Parasedimentitalea psychrophila TaxID=2997337 RepID=A0A9Y2L1B1_9RHOB|nr:glycosyltransferase [Parasedimentitalea psychrophila]WIY26333.1 glycosyltransferase [Parasedimentitalea psychrophila]